MDLFLSVRVKGRGELKDVSVYVVRFHETITNEDHRCGLIVVTMNDRAVSIVLLTAFFRFAIYVRGRQLNDTYVSLIVIRNVRVFISMRRPMDDPVIRGTVTNDDGFATFR